MTPEQAWTHADAHRADYNAPGWPAHAILDDGLWLTCEDCGWCMRYDAEGAS